MKWRAPGRVNLMGDHTDYNEGFVLPMAIQLECLVTGEPLDEPVLRLRSLQEEGEVELPADGSAEPRTLQPPWGRYVAGVASALAKRGRRPAGFAGVVESSVPVGSGLSSSAALEVACALALCHAGGLELPPREIALACQEAEHRATGVPSGLMDQLASVFGRAGSALLIDCRNLDIEIVPMAADIRFVVVHSGQDRTLEGSEYAARRAECERIAAELGLRSLRDAREEQVADLPIARHVVSENARVRAVASALAAGNGEEIGRRFTESHASLRDDFRVSTPVLDSLVEELLDAGALGARLTGAGFGGAVVAVCEAAEADRILETVRAGYPRAWVVDAVDGAGLIP
jgi:galactokinase